MKPVFIQIPYASMVGYFGPLSTAILKDHASFGRKNRGVSILKAILNIFFLLSMVSYT